MTYRRRILRYGPAPTALLGTLNEDAISGCWFELHRLGGCGTGELELRAEFTAREGLQVGEWVACEYDDGDRWYLGRIEQRVAKSPGGVTLRLEGMGVELGEVYPGGFDLEADGKPPHRYSRSDRFPGDPDYDRESRDTVDRPEAAIRLLLDQYVLPATHITLDESLLEDAPFAAEFVSLKFNGEETVRSILKDLALRLKNAAWGVNEQGQFFLLQPRTTAIASYQEGVDLSRLVETQERAYLYNRVLLTGGYIYAQPELDSAVTGAVRWRGSYRQPDSITQYGERRIRLWVPWLRTPEDSRQFLREFFRIYAVPTKGYDLEIPNQSVCPRPWLGPVEVVNREGTRLIVANVETVRVQFDAAPRLRMTVGPDDPRTHWPEPPHDERFPILRSPASSDVGLGGGGGPITLTLGPGGSGGGDSTDFPSGSLATSSEALTSDVTSSALTSSAATSPVLSSSALMTSDHESLLSTSDLVTSELGSFATSALTSLASSGLTSSFGSDSGFTSLSDVTSRGSESGTTGSLSSMNSSILSSDSGTTSSSAAGPTSSGVVTSEFGSGSGFSSSGSDSQSSWTGAATDPGCPECEAVPTTWRVTISGTATGSCTGCALFNGTHDLTLTGAFGNCSWVIDLGSTSDCGPASLVFFLEVSGPQLLAKIDNDVVATWVPTQVWECLGENTLAIQSHTGDCQTWPTQVTLTPV